MQYTPHYNLNLPEGSDIVNPLVQDNPNYTAIDSALYNNKLRVIGTATHVKTGTNHAITLGDSDIDQFKFVATGDYAAGDTFTVDGVTVTARIADGSSIPSGAFKINSTVLCVLDGTVLNLINVYAAVTPSANDISYDNSLSGLSADKVQGAIDEINTKANAVKHEIERNELDVPFAIATPLGTPYTLLSDGYLNLKASSTSDSATVLVYGATNNYNYFTLELFETAAVILNNTVFLRKGMRVVITAKSGNPLIQFIPFQA